MVPALQELFEAWRLGQEQSCVRPVVAGQSPLALSGQRQKYAHQLSQEFHKAGVCSRWAGSLSLSSPAYSTPVPPPVYGDGAISQG